MKKILTFFITLGLVFTAMFSVSALSGAKTAKAGSDYSYSDGLVFYDDFQYYSANTLTENLTNLAHNWGQASMHADNSGKIMADGNNKYLQFIPYSNYSFYYLSPTSTSTSGRLSATNFLIETDFRYTQADGSGWWAWQFRKSADAGFDQVSSYMLAFEFDGTNLKFRLYQTASGSVSEKKQSSVPLSNPLNTWHTMKIQVNGTNIEAFLDTAGSSNPTFSYTMPSNLSNSNYFSLNGCQTSAQVDNVSILDMSKKTSSTPWVKDTEYAIPTAGTNAFTYDGSAKTYTPNGFDADKMTISGNSYTNAGSYVATVNLKDPSNSKWLDGTTTAKTLNWTINKASVTAPTAGTNTFTFADNAQTYTPSGFDGNKMTISGNVQTNAGSYNATVSLKDVNNYKWSDTNDSNAKQMPFSITAMAISKPTSPVVTSFEYSGEDITFSLTGFSSNTMSISGNTAKNAGSYTASVNLKNNNYKWNDNTTSELTFNWTITKKELVIPQNASVTSFEYTGDTITYLPNGYDAETMNITGNSGVNYNSYTVTVSLKDTANYVWVGGGNSNKTFYFNITKKSIAEPTLPSVSSFEYTGSVITIALNGFNSASMSVVSGNKATNAGSYTVIVSLANENYKWATGGSADKSFTWQITKKVVAVPTAGNSTIKYVEGEYAGYLPQGYNASIMNISGNVKNGIGSYTAVVTLKDTANYAWADGTSTEKSFNWSVAADGADSSFDAGSTGANNSTSSGLKGNSLTQLTDAGKIAIVLLSVAFTALALGFVFVFMQYNKLRKDKR